MSISPALFCVPPARAHRKRPLNAEHSAPAPPGDARPVRFSVVIPARDEEGSIDAVIRDITDAFARAAITDYEILAVDDNSRDGTGRILRRLGRGTPRLRCLRTPEPGGFGTAVRLALRHARGEAVAIVMADRSESPDDVVAYYRACRAGAGCVFGSRFIPGARVTGYPAPKRIANRIGNALLGVAFGIRHNDITNAFKAYRREVIHAAMPLQSHGFELCVELPLKALLQGCEVAVVPVSWQERRAGRSKFHTPANMLRYALTALRLRWHTKHRRHRCPPPWYAPRGPRSAQCPHRCRAARSSCIHAPNNTI